MKKKFFIAILVLAFFLNYAQTEINLDNYFRTLKSVKVEIDEKIYNFLFDTGAGITIISPQIAAKLDKTVYGRNIGFRMSGEKVEMQLCDNLDIGIGGIDFFHPYVAVFDIMSLLPEEFERIDGMISLKTFENNAISLNLSQNKLIVETAETYKEKIKSMDLIPSRFANANNGSELNILVGIEAQNHLWWFLFDTGNILATKISKNIAQEWNLKYDHKGLTELGIFEFKIADDYVSTTAIIDDIIYDGALSFDFIQQFEYTISFKDEKIWKSTIDHSNE